RNDRSHSRGNSRLSLATPGNLAGFEFESSVETTPCFSFVRRPSRRMPEIGEIRFRRILVRSMRRASIVLAVASLLLPAALFGQALLDAHRELQMRGGAVCGMPLLASFILSLLLCVLLSGVAFVLGVVAFRRVAPPRPRRRFIELVALFLLVLVAGGYLASFFVTL